MEFVVLLSVLAITLTQVIARPADIGDNSETKNLKEESNLDTFKFLLPTALRHDLQIIIKGVLDLNGENFTVVLPIEGKEENTHCTLNYNHKDKKLLVFPATNTEIREEIYKSNDDDDNDPDFIFSILSLENDNSIKTLEMSLDRGGWGGSPVMTCIINSFEDFNYIHFKGVKHIKSLFFQYQSSEVS